MKYEVVLFDLDGTILDTNELILTSFMYTLERFYPEKYTREDVIPLMGDTLYKQMEKFDPERAQEMVEMYREHNERVHDELVETFPNVKEVIRTLKDKGIKMGVVTTKQRKTAWLGLQYLGIESYMESVVSFDDTENHKPHPEPVLKALDQLKSRPEKTLMVGDSQFDIQAAKNAGAASCGVSWSIKGAEFLRQFKPDYIIDDLLELIPIVEGHTEYEGNSKHGVNRKHEGKTDN